MKKTMTILALAALTATSAMTMQTTSAEAGRGFRLGVGVGLGVGLALRHRHQHRQVYREPVYTETYRATRPKPVSDAVFADGKGREYDPATKVWFDGKGACWTGKQKWAFKRGAWFYGSNRWYEANGIWQTDVDGEPVPVDCKAAPQFAARAKTGPAQNTIAKGSTQYSEARGNAAEAGAAPAKTALKAPSEEPTKVTSQTRECKKYFPAVGEMLAVPCT